MKAQTRQKLLIPLNALLFLVMLMQLITALSFTFGWGNSLAYTLHTIGGYGMFALIGLHLFLNGNWIGSVLKKKVQK